MSDKSKEPRVYGPSLCPDDVAPSGGIGPAIPEHLFKKKLAEDYETKPETDFESLDTIGPLIPGQELREEWRHLKSETDEPSNVSSSTRTTDQVRDAWMTELLPISNDANSLRARKFRQTVGPTTGDRCDSSWFKTPGASTDVNQKLELEDLKNQQKEMIDHDASAEYNKKMADVVAKCGKSNAKESLLELHEKKLAHKRKKEKKKQNKKDKKHRHKEKKHKKKHKHKSPSPEEPQRRPFDRDRDLKISRIDTAARRAIIEHSKHLASKFGHGKQQFL